MSPSDLPPQPETPRDPARPGGAGQRPRRPLAASLAAGVLLAVAIVVPLLVFTYAKDRPRLWGFPFFYWYQLMWVFIAAAATYVSYLLVRRVERPHGALTDRSEPRGQVRP